MTLGNAFNKGFRRGNSKERDDVSPAVVIVEEVTETAAVAVEVVVSCIGSACDPTELRALRERESLRLRALRDVADVTTKGLMQSAFAARSLVPDAGLGDLESAGLASELLSLVDEGKLEVRIR